eukprot:gene4079-4751_t
MTASDSERLEWKKNFKSQGTLQMMTSSHTGSPSSTSFKGNNGLNNSGGYLAGKPLHNNNSSSSYNNSSGSSLNGKAHTPMINANATVVFPTFKSNKPIVTTAPSLSSSTSDVITPTFSQIASNNRGIINTTPPPSSLPTPSTSTSHPPKQPNPQGLFITNAISSNTDEDMDVLLDKLHLFTNTKPEESPSTNDYTLFSAPRQGDRDDEDDYLPIDNSFSAPNTPTHQSATSTINRDVFSNGGFSTWVPNRSKSQNSNIHQSPNFSVFSQEQQALPPRDISGLIAPPGFSGIPPHQLNYPTHQSQYMSLEKWFGNQIFSYPSAAPSIPSSAKMINLEDLEQNSAVWTNNM